VGFLDGEVGDQQKQGKQGEDWFGNEHGGMGLSTPQRFSLIFDHL
jgi:hypothetical protein